MYKVTIYNIDLSKNKDIIKQVKFYDKKQKASQVARRYNTLFCKSHNIAIARGCKGYV